MKSFKYKSTFNSFAKIVEKNENFDIAIASLDNLKNIVPSSVNFDSNPDIVFTAFNAAVCGMANKNDDLITNEDGIAIYKNFIYKFCQI